MHLHIDGDLLVYRCGFAAEKGEYRLEYCDLMDDFRMEAYTYKKDLETRIKRLGLEEGSYEVAFNRQVEPVENALHNVKSVIESTVEQLQPDSFTVYLSGPTNFRYGVATIKDYKGNRDKAHKPVHGPAIRDYIRQKYETVTSEDEEADDVVGYSHYAMWLKDPESSVVVSVDKDLDMIPGLHYNFVKEEGYEINEEYANYLFYKQLLTGDSTDNIQGIPKVGAVRAEKFLADTPREPRKMYKRCRELYEDAFGPDADEVLLENARLLYIRREPFEMWEPPE